MIPTCLVCHDDAQSLSDVRGFQPFEEVVLEALAGSGSQDDRNAPLLACFNCIGRIIDSQVEDPSVSIPNLLRDATSIDAEVAAPNSPSGSSSESSSQIVVATSEDVVAAVGSQNTVPLPPADPRLLARYNEIVNKPMPLKTKKRRLEELLNNVQEPEVTSASETTVPAVSSERIRSDILKMKRSRPQRTHNGSSSSSSLSQPLTQPPRVGQPSRTNPIIGLGNSSNSQPMQPPPSRRPGPLSRRSQQPLLPAHRTPPSSLSSNEDRLNFLITGGYQAPSLPDSPPIPATVRPRDDSNSHTNVGAPRRINQPRSSSPQTRATVRPVMTKNFGG